MLRDNWPRGGRGSQVKGQGTVQVRGYHNNNQHNISGGGYYKNRAEFKFYTHTYCI